MYRRTPVTPQPRICHSIGEDDIRVVRTMFWAGLIGLAIWMVLLWIASTYFDFSLAWFV